MTSCDVTSRTSRDGCVLSACSIFINNASLWKTLQATFLFYLICVCVFIYRNDSLLMLIYKYEKIIRLDVLISMRDMSVRARSPATWSAFCWEKNIFDPLSSENAGKNTAIFLKCQLLSDVTSQSAMTFYDVTIRDFTSKWVLHVNGSPTRIIFHF